MPRGDGKSDLSAINELMKRIMELEKNFNEFVEKVNIEEIYRQLKFLNDTKADKKDLLCKTQMFFKSLCLPGGFFNRVNMDSAQET